jgi:putative ABC transport system permease protein
LRTFLTGLSVASGIFILVILLGFGQGMENGVRKEFEKDASNRIWIWTQVTTKEYKGLNPGRLIELQNANYDHITSVYIDKLESRSGLFRVRGGTINYKEESGAYSIQGVSPEYQQLENQKMVSGRYLNYADMDNRNKVVVISSKVKRELMKNVENPLNEYLQISGINFKIIGVFTDEGGEREENRIFVPLTTAQFVFNGSNKMDANLGTEIDLTVGYKIAKDITLSAGYSKMFATDTMELLKGGDRDEDNSWGWIMFTFKPKLFSSVSNSN